MSKPGKRLDKRRSKTSRCDKDLGRLGELSGNRSKRRGIVHVALLSLVLFDLRANRTELFLNCQHVLDVRCFLQELYQLRFFCPKNLKSRLDIYVLRGNIIRTTAAARNGTKSCKIVHELSSFGRRHTQHGSRKHLSVRLLKRRLCHETAVLGNKDLTVAESIFCVDHVKAEAGIENDLPVYRRLPIDRSYRGWGR